MKLKIKLVDESMPLPEYHTSGSVAFDLYSRVDVEVIPGTPTVIPSNLIVEVPKGHFLLLAARSSMAKKFGLMLANGIGVIDQDYCGEADEIGVSVLNFTKSVVSIKKGERIAQAILVKISIPSAIVKKKAIKKVSRGGWGSTGHKIRKKV